MTGNKFEILRVLKRIGSRGAHFQFRDVREALGVRTDDKSGSARVFSALASLEQEGIVEEVPGNRKRNKYYRLKDEERVRELTGAPSVSPAPTAPRPTGGLSVLNRIESDLRQVLDRLDQVESKMAELAAIWA